MMPSVRKVRILCSDPDATDSSDSEDDQNPKKEKKVIGQVLLPSEKEPSSRHCGARQRSSGRWEAAIRNPFTKKREFSTHDTEEEAAAAYLARANQFRAVSSSSSASCVSSSVACEQKAQEARSGVGVFKEIHHEPMDESLLNLALTPEVSGDSLLNRIDLLSVSDSIVGADKPPLDDFTRPEDFFLVSDFVGATYGPPDGEYIGLADISHLSLPTEDPEFDLEAALDWSEFDLASVERELELL